MCTREISSREKCVMERERDRVFVPWYGEKVSVCPVYIGSQENRKREVRV